MDKDRAAGFSTVVALSLVAIVVACVAFTVPLLTHHKSAAAAAVSTTNKKSGVPLLGSAVDKAGDAAMKSDLRSVAEAVETQNVDNLNYGATTWGGGPAAAGASISGPGQTVGGGTVNVSLGNTITWVGATATSFCLMVTNNEGSTGPWYYSNLSGGLSQTACTS